MIPLSAPSLKGNEWKYVKECLETEWVSSVGTYVETFERNVADYLGARYAVACVNGTAALHISLLIAEVQPCDEVIVPTVTFIAPVNAVHYTGATPLFMDCDDYCTLDIDKTEEFLRTQCTVKGGRTFNKKTNRRIAAVLPVHVFGVPVNMDPLLELAERYHITVIEDATESLGSRYKGKMTGTFGLLGSLSFNGNKILTTGGGGMIITDQEYLAKKARYLTTQAKEDGMEYIHNDIGHNYRMVNVLAAIGVAQLENIDAYLALKRKNYTLYQQALTAIHCRMLDEPPYALSNRWFYALCCRDSEEKNRILTHLNREGVQARPLWFLNHLQKPYAHCQAYAIEQAPRMYDTLVNIPCSVSLTEQDIREVVGRIKEVL